MKRKFRGGFQKFIIKRLKRIVDWACKCSKYDEGYKLMGMGGAVCFGETRSSVALLTWGRERSRVAGRGSVSSWKSRVALTLQAGNILSMESNSMRCGSKVVWSNMVAWLHCCMVVWAEVAVTGMLLSLWEGVQISMLWLWYGRMFASITMRWNCCRVWWGGWVAVTGM